MSNLVFIDTETTGLDPNRHEVWEIAAIVRKPGEPDVEYCWQIRPELATADPTGLRIGRYYERSLLARGSMSEAIVSVHPDYVGYGLLDVERYRRTSSVAHDLALMFDGVHLVGAVPSFDAAFLDRFLRRHGQAPTWHHHLIDIEALTVGYLSGKHGPGNGPLPLPLPWKSGELSRLVGVEPDPAARHTALGDARWARDIYDAVTGHRDG